MGTQTGALAVERHGQSTDVHRLDWPKSHFYYYREVPNGRRALNGDTGTERCRSFLFHPRLLSVTLKYNSSLLGRLEHLNISLLK